MVLFELYDAELNKGILEQHAVHQEQLNNRLFQNQNRQKVKLQMQLEKREARRYADGRALLASLYR